MESSYNKIYKRISSFCHSQSLVLPNETDIVNVLQQRNFEEKFEQIMEGSNSQLYEYFRYMASSQQMSHPPSDWENTKKLFIEIIDTLEQ